MYVSHRVQPKEHGFPEASPSHVPEDDCRRGGCRSYRLVLATEVIDVTFNHPECHKTDIVRPDGAALS